MFGISGHTRERLKLAREDAIPVPTPLHTKQHSTELAGTQGLPRRQDAMALLCKFMRRRTHQGTGRVLS